MFDRPGLPLLSPPPSCAPAYERGRGRKACAPGRIDRRFRAGRLPSWRLGDRGGKEREDRGAKKTKYRSIKTQKAARHFAGARLFDLEMVAHGPALPRRGLSAGAGECRGAGAHDKAGAPEKNKKPFLALKNPPQKNHSVLQLKVRKGDEKGREKEGPVSRREGGNEK